MDEPIPINIGNINDGAMVEGFEIELRKALMNIADLNTPATATRKVTLTLVMRPHSDRITIETEFKCSSSLAAIEVNRAKCFMGLAEDGTPIECHASELDEFNNPLEPDEFDVCHHGVGFDENCGDYEDEIAAEGLHALAIEIADMAAISFLDCHSVPVHEGDAEWWNLGDVLEFLEDCEEELRYLELRGLLERHPEHANWIRVKVLEIEEAANGSSSI